jgi:ATPase subunit of ABC transporter with duplicated ATPase domains
MAAVRLLLTGLAIGVALGLTSCGGDPYADYCDVVTSHQEQLTTTLGEGGPQALLEALPTFEELRDRAPSDVEDDWATLTKALTELEAALEQADVDPATYDPDRPPAGVTSAERDRIAAAATVVGGERTRAALAAVDQQARDVCHAPLTL